MSIARGCEIMDGKFPLYSFVKVKNLFDTTFFVRRGMHGVVYVISKFHNTALRLATSMICVIIVLAYLTTRAPACCVRSKRNAPDNERIFQ